MFYVYRIVRRETGKQYFGWTSESPNQRWWRHKNHAKEGDGYAIHDAMRRHGIDAFDFEVVLEVGTAAEAKLAEMYYIAGFKTNLRRVGHWGYNLTDGGEGIVGFTHDDETKARIGAAKRGKPSPLRGRPKDPKAIAKTAVFNRGRKFTPEHRARLSAAKLGKKQAKRGPLSEEHKESIRRTLKARYGSLPQENEIQEKHD